MADQPDPLAELESLVDFLEARSDSDDEDSLSPLPAAALAWPETKDIGKTVIPPIPSNYLFGDAMTGKPPANLRIATLNIGHLSGSNSMEVDVVPRLVALFQFYRMDVLCLQEFKRWHDEASVARIQATFAASELRFDFQGHPPPSPRTPPGVRSNGVAIITSLSIPFLPNTLRNEVHRDFAPAEYNLCGRILVRLVPLTTNYTHGDLLAQGQSLKGRTIQSDATISYIQQGTIHA